MLALISPGTAKLKLAENIKKHRISNNFTQQELSERTQVPLGTLRRFEQTGNIGTSALVRILGVLHLLEPFISALEYKYLPRTLKEVEELSKKPSRKRVRKKKE